MLRRGQSSDRDLGEVCSGGRYIVVGLLPPIVEITQVPGNISIPHFLQAPPQCNVRIGRRNGTTISITEIASRVHCRIVGATNGGSLSAFI